MLYRTASSLRNLRLEDSEISIQKESNDANDDTAKHPSSISTFSTTHDDTLPTIVNVYKVISKSNTTLESQ